MSPEPDLVASTKSSSGSDKSNSLPRADQECPPPDLSSVDIPSKPQLPKSEAFPTQHLPYSEPPKEDQPPEPPPKITSVAPAAPHCQPSVTSNLPNAVEVQCVISPADCLNVHVPTVVAQAPPQAQPGPLPSNTAMTSANNVPVVPPRRKRKTRQNTDGVSKD